MWPTTASEERMTELERKLKKIKLFAREAVKITPQQVSSDDGAELQSLREAFQEAQKQILVVMKEAEVR